MSTSATASPSRPDRLLEVKDLRVVFRTYAGTAEAVNGFDLAVDRGEMVALVGESGSGKSVTAWSIVGLTKPPGRVVGGEVLWRGRNVREMSAGELRAWRGGGISLILSNPRSHLHPLIAVGKQVDAVYRAHNGAAREAPREATLAILKAVGLPDPLRVYRSHPHELSGGMAQRILIGMAMINSPQLVIADDATNGLDMTVQRQVLDLMTAQIRDRNAANLMITHDLGIVAQYCQRATVMYAGQAVETASTRTLFRRPLHPYTQAIIASAGPDGKVAKRTLPGVAPDLFALPKGCVLEPRCPVRRAECKVVRPRMTEVEPGHSVRCILYEPGPTAAPARPSGAAAPSAPTPIENA